MAEDVTNGTAYLMALKQPIRTPNAAAEVPGHVPSPESSAVVVDTNAGERFPATEKRRSPRYKCEGSVEMRKEDCDVRTWATFTDVSLHGCYVEAQATYPVGTGLDIKLQANDVRVETKGVVRVNYPYLGMGIAFVEMSDEQRGLLKSLLGTLTYPTVVMGSSAVPSPAKAASQQSQPPSQDVAAALHKVMAFFDDHSIMTKEDFQGLLNKCQPPETRH
jgi:PilZ domain